ncbi:MAG TPA: hypothetical protein VI757_11710 [Bacteroidia bacterium]|nr:hypothetical protein [Bacteroidia bacterium]
MNSDMLLGIIIILAVSHSACLQVMLDYKKKYKNVSRTISNSGLWYDSQSDKLFMNDDTKKKTEIE